MGNKPQLTENEIMCRDLMERNGEIDGLREWVAEREAVCASLAADALLHCAEQLREGEIK